MTIYIPVKPISVNVCWQGRRFATSEYKNWRESMLLQMPRKEEVKGNVELRIFLHLKSLIRGDIDNYCKPIIDCLVKKKYITDDRYIQRLVVEKVKGNKEGVEIEIIIIKNK